MKQLFLLLVISIGACTSSDTAIMLEVVPGAVDPATLDEVVFRVSGPGLPAEGREAHAPLRGAEARPFPLSLVIVQEQSGSGPFSARIEALASGAVRATAAGDGIAFQSKKVVHRRFTLRDVNAPPPDAAPPDAARDATPPPPDVAPPPPPDAAPPPIAPPPATCTRVLACVKKGAPCSCDPGCRCAIACAVSECTPVCDGEGTTCNIVGDHSKKVLARCANGASCDLSCGSAETCELMCQDAACLVRCENAHTCSMSGCAPMTCPGNVRVCGRPCP
jgi:hypothetical protein